MFIYFDVVIPIRDPTNTQSRSHDSVTIQYNVCVRANLFLKRFKNLLYSVQINIYF